MILSQFHQYLILKKLLRKSRETPGQSSSSKGKSTFSGETIPESQVPIVVPQ
jgi:hypothetical protein